MKKFPKKFNPIFGVAVVKLRFHVAVAVAVAVGQTTVRRGMHAPGKCSRRNNLKNYDRALQIREQNQKEAKNCFQ